MLALCGGVLLACVAFSTIALSHGDDDDDFIPIEQDSDLSNPNVTHFSYIYAINSNVYYDYDAVRKAMFPTFKGTHVDPATENSFNPLIGIAEYDLNNDKTAERIAFPIENAEWGNVFCGDDYLCPHYVIDVSSGDAKVIGVLPAFAVDRGEEIKNGYWTLKAFTKQDDPNNFSYYDLYAYEPSERKYVKAGSSSLAKDKEDQ